MATNNQSIHQLLEIYKTAVVDDLKHRGSLTEFEIRFDSKRINKTIFENIFKSLFSRGFKIDTSNYSLKTSIHFETEKARNIESKIRFELQGLNQIQEYCKNKSGTIPEHGTFLLKSHVNERIKRPVMNYDLGFRTSIEREIKLRKENPKILSIKSEWPNSFKTFRYIYRTSLIHSSEFPNIRVDLSKVKMNKSKERNITKSDVFMQNYIYEVEIEIININGRNMTLIESNDIEGQLKKVVKFILCGIQHSIIPVSFKHLDTILKKYLNVCKVLDDSKIPYEKNPKNFMGPSSFTLQKNNLIKSKINEGTICIKDDFCITDKADGERKLLFITRLDKESDLEVYFIDINLNIQHTGLYIKNSKGIKINNTIIDGEHIKYDKYGNFINLFAGFDVYTINSKDLRTLPFIEDRTDEFNHDTFRYGKLRDLISLLSNYGITESKTQTNRLQLETKTFFFSKKKDEYSIFDQCRTLFDKMKSNLYNYNTDGIIFTSKYLGVTQEHSRDTIKKGKYTWGHSFKWKPPEYNTIDFLIRVKKDQLNHPIVYYKNSNTTKGPIEYYIVELMVGFDVKKHGHINSQDKILNHSFKEKSNYQTNTYKPELFYPTNPSDRGAHICYMELKRDETGTLNMFSEEKELIEDDTIVEFKYQQGDHYTNWIPLRVRYDKTSDYKNGKSNFGNAYHVANSNWQSIHNPITEELLVNGKSISEDILLNTDNDVYYNKSKAKSQTNGLKNFHNLYVKHLLIEYTSSRNPKSNLIDMAVGKGGDLPKWIKCNLNGVFGIDISKDNIHNQKDGACARYLDAFKTCKNPPISMFVHGDTGKLIENGDFENVDSEMNISDLNINNEFEDNNQLLDTNKGSNYILNCLMGSNDIDKKTIREPYLQNHFGIFSEKFDICSIQFALHYMFESKLKLHQFLTNISKYTKKNGHFIGTCYDGKKIYNKLKTLNKNECYELFKNKNKIWHIKKKYVDEEDVFLENNEESIGYMISVYQESINKEFDEYLVNFDYFIKLMNDYGFVLEDEITTSYGNIPPFENFEHLFHLMNKEPSNKINNYGKASVMSKEEKEISFLNNYFIFKKQRDIIRPLYDVNSNEEIDFTISKAKKINKTIILN